MIESTGGPEFLFQQVDKLLYYSIKKNYFALVQQIIDGQ